MKPGLHSEQALWPMWSLKINRGAVLLALFLKGVKCLWTVNDEAQMPVIQLFQVEFFKLPL